MVSTVERRRHLDQLSLEWIREVAELDATGAHLRHGYTSPTAFLIDRCGLAPGEAQRFVALGRMLARLAAATTAVRAGGLSFTQLQALADALTTCQRRLRHRRCFSPHRRPDRTGAGTPGSAMTASAVTAPERSGRYISGMTTVRSHAPMVQASRSIQAGWMAAVLVVVLVGALGMSAAYREPHLIAIPVFIDLIDTAGISERLAMTVSFLLPILASLALVVVVFVARRDDGMALLFSLTFLAVFVLASGSPGALRASVPSLAPLALVTELIALESLAFLLYLFPNGRLQPRWIAVVLVPCVVAVLAYPPLATSVRLIAADPAAVPSGVTLATRILTGVVMLGAVVGQVIRYRRHATQPERQQMRWVLLGLAVLVAPATLTTVGASLESGPWAGWLILGASLAGVVAPLTAGVAIFRYRLYDIDLVVNRTVVYVALTGFLGLVYAGSVVIMSRLIGLDGDLGVAVSTLTVAGLFSPARSRIQRFVDARFYRSRYDSLGTLDAFRSRLRHEFDLAALGGALTTAVQHTLQPEQVSLWLSPGSSPLTPPTGAPRAPTG